MGSKMTRSEAGKLGGIKGGEIHRLKMLVKAQEYEENPNKCLMCKRPISYEKRQNRFCNHSCAASLGVNKNKKTILKQKCLVCNNMTKNKIYCSNICRFPYERKIRLGNGTASNRALKLIVIDRDGKKCSICSLFVWMSKPIGLILDHINGNPDNNNLDNLRLVCANCDEQLPTYKSRNKGNGRYSRRMRYAKGQSY